MDRLAYSWDDIALDSPIPLLERQRVIGEQVLLAKVHLMPGCHVALHHHESEQFAILLSGRVRWGLGNPGSEERREFEMQGSGVLHLPSNLPHEVHAIEDTWILDVLSPPGAMGIDSQSKS